MLENAQKQNEHWPKETMDKDRGALENEDPPESSPNGFRNLLSRVFALSHRYSDQFGSNECE